MFVFEWLLYIYNSHDSEYLIFSEQMLAFFIKKLEKKWNSGIENLI